MTSTASHGQTISSTINLTDSNKRCKRDKWITHSTSPTFCYTVLAYSVKIKKVLMKPLKSRYFSPKKGVFIKNQKVSFKR